MTSRDVILTVFPAFGRVGFAWIAAGVLFGARNVLMDFHPGRGAAPDRDGAGDDLNLVPTMAAMLLADPCLPQRDLRSLRALVFAGAMFPAPLRERTAAALCPGDLRVLRHAGDRRADGQHARGPHAVSRIRSAFRSAFAEVRIERPDGYARRAGRDSARSSDARPPPAPAISTIRRNRPRRFAAASSTPAISAR